jgi:peptidoglycan/LPS O-acetylase OafA/YrhL
MKYNIPVINNLRGIAAVCVCLYHLVCTTKGYIQDKTVFNIFNYGDHGVQVFFVISGIVIPLSMIKSGYRYEHWGKFLLKRFARLEPPYLCALILSLIYFQLRNYVPSSADIDKMLSAREIALHIGYLIPLDQSANWALPSFWTLSIEFQYYLLLSLLAPMFLKGKLILRVLFYLFLLAMPYTGFPGSFFPDHASLFMIGIAYALWITKKIEVKEYALVTILSLIVCATTLPYSHLIVGLATLLVVHFFASYHNKLLGFFGMISYSLYLLHQVVGNPAVNFLSHRFHESWQKPLVITFGFILSVAAAYGLYRLVELPSLRLSKRIGYGSQDKKANYTAAV